MHSFKGPEGTNFNFNSDLSGEAHVNVPLAMAETIGPFGNEPQRMEVKIPCADLIAFVAQYVRRERAAAIEDMEDEQVLGLPPADWRSC